MNPAWFGICLNLTRSTITTTTTRITARTTTGITIRTTTRIITTQVIPRSLAFVIWHFGGNLDTPKMTKCFARLFRLLSTDGQNILATLDLMS